MCIYKLKIWWTFQNWHCRNTHVDYVGHISKMCHSCSFGVSSTQLTTKLLPKYKLVVHFLLTRSMQIGSLDPAEDWERSPRDGFGKGHGLHGLGKDHGRVQGRQTGFGKDNIYIFTYIYIHIYSGKGKIQLCRFWKRPPCTVRNVQKEWLCCYKKYWLDIDWILMGYW